jgi:hypothetical protein
MSRRAASHDDAMILYTILSTHTCTVHIGLSRDIVHNLFDLFLYPFPCLCLEDSPLAVSFSVLITAFPGRYRCWVYARLETTSSAGFPLNRIALHLQMETSIIRAHGVAIGKERVRQMIHMGLVDQGLAASGKASVLTPFCWRPSLCEALCPQARDSLRSGASRALSHVCCSAATRYRKS